MKVWVSDLNGERAPRDARAAEQRRAAADREPRAAELGHAAARLQARERALLREAHLDSVVKVSSADALAMTRRLSREFGLLVGTSSGANVAAALRTARDLGPESRVVTILCDRAERYYSTKLFDHPPEATGEPA